MVLGPLVVGPLVLGPLVLGSLVFRSLVLGSLVGRRWHDGRQRRAVTRPLSPHGAGGGFPAARPGCGVPQLAHRRRIAWLPSAVSQALVGG